MNKDSILKEYPYKTELHLHSMPASSCCTCPMERCLELYAERNVNAICLTNHFYLNNGLFNGKPKEECIKEYLADYERMKELAKPYGIKIILGCEIRFGTDNANDYLIYGVNKEILEQAFDYLPYTVEKYRTEVVLKDSLFIQAHPFRKNIFLADPKFLDGIESLNMHVSHKNCVSTAAFYAKENNFSICVGGTDFHHDRPYYTATLLMLSKRLATDSFDLVKLLKEKDYVFLLGDNHIVIP